ncbi:hypothetical protein Tco_1359993 [Tanacetum coccineum]
MSSLRLVEGSSNGGDEVGTDMGKVLVSLMDGDIWVWCGESRRVAGLRGGAGDNTGEGGDSGSDEEGIWGSGEDHGKSGDDGGVDIARSLATSASDLSSAVSGCSSSFLIPTSLHDHNHILISSNGSSYRLSSSPPFNRIVTGSSSGSIGHLPPGLPRIRLRDISQRDEQWVRHPQTPG